MNRGVFTLFEAVVALPPEQRPAFLDRECAGMPGLRADVEAMLRADAELPPSLLERPALGPGFDLVTATQDAVAALPQRIGEFEILERIGAGSGGVVFRARQPDPQREVALKLLHATDASPGAVRRFANEIAALARLRHPGIAHIYQTGVATVWGAELPFLAMELVNGMTLDVWRTSVRPDWRQSVTLVLQLLEAVEYAHQHGVIHRDLKPSNIVVETGAPRPRVLDFGVARVDQQGETAPGTVVGTWPYLSPEQAAGITDADTGCDVYSVGALLYELLTDRPPTTQGDSLAESLRRVRDEEPPRLGHLAPHVPTDLELVVHKAIARARDARYAAAGAFADDLRRVLLRLPVTARRPTAWYLARMFALRHRTLVLAGSVLILAALLALGSLIHAGIAAEQARQRISAVLTAITRRVFALEPQLGTATLRHELLTDMGRELTTLLAAEPDVPEYLILHADQMVALGNIEVQLDHRDAARPLREAALRTRERVLALRPGLREQRAQHATDLVRLGDLDRTDGTPAGGAPRYRAAHAEFERLLQEAPDDVRALDDLAHSCHRLAHVAIDAGDFADAEVLLARHGQVAHQLDALVPDRIPNLTVHRDHWTMRGHLEFARGAHDLALRHMEQGLRVARTWLERRPADTAAWVGYLGLVRSMAEQLRDDGQAEAAARVVAAARADLERVPAHADDERVVQCAAFLRAWSTSGR